MITINAIKKTVIDVEALKIAHYATLESLVYDFGDGRIVQTRPQDEQNLKIAVENNADREWLMVNNVPAWFTVAEIQTAYISGKAKATAQWDTFISELKILLGV